MDDVSEVRDRSPGPCVRHDRQRRIDMSNSVCQQGVMGPSQNLYRIRALPKGSDQVVLAGRTDSEFRNWSGARDLNPRPHGPELCAASSMEVVFEGFGFISRTWWRVSSQIQPPDSPRLLHELLHMQTPPMTGTARLLPVQLPEQFPFRMKNHSRFVQQFY